MQRNALATAPAMSAADKAAHDAASYLSPAGAKALHNLELATAEILRNRQTGDAARADIAVYGNWIPNVAPEPEDMWDVAIDAYGTRRLPMTLSAA